MMASLRTALYAALNRAGLSRRALGRGLLGACFSALGGARAARALPRVVIGPPGEAAMRELFAHPEQWAETRRVVDALLHADHSFGKVGDAELRAWFVQMAGWGLGLELEVGAIKEWSATGRHTFELQRPNWERVRRLGGNCKSIAMDEPLLSTRRDWHKGDDYAMEETAEFVRLARETYPDLLIGDIEPYPSIPMADHTRWIAGLQAALAARGVRGLDFYRIDPDWIAFTQAKRGSWQEVKNIELFCRARKIPFSLIYWASDYPGKQKRNAASDATWYQGTMHEAADFAQTGLAPDQFVIESWVGAPSHAVPDSDPLSFTGAALALVRKFSSLPVAGIKHG